MDILVLIASYLAQAVSWIWRAAQFTAVGLGIWALIDTLTHDPSHFIAAGKRTKGFWLGANAAGVAVVLLMGATSMLGLLGVVANAVYLADVRPALRYYAPVRVRSSIRFPGNGRGSRGGRGPRDWTPGR
ncbi:DUF2516 family protein [Actinomyces ruminis]|uniref:DUF2516 domain-containing protein n=1 Tax=Actinomyces ruminis TaxID=1937003 RepID=A0ABX4MC03_9ACTO|nr:DUF2516 family protein [Actinomyces ruminis]PHP53020.1 DUF2516 domain-containing protein [Actinomyces ruminis]